MNAARRFRRKSPRSLLSSSCSARVENRAKKLVENESDIVLENV